MALILHHFDHDWEVIVETNTSDYISASILLQYDDEGVLYPVAFFSKKHSPAECNYKIHDKEPMAIVRAFEEWRPKLEGALHPIKVLSDHKNLEYFMMMKLLNCWQTWWAEFLSCFHFKIVYRPGKASRKPDSLTRRSGDLPQGGDEYLIEQQKAFLKPQNLPNNPPHLSANGPPNNLPYLSANGLPDNLPHLSANDLHLLADAPTPDGQSSLLHSIEKATKTDPFTQRIITALFEGKQHSREITLSECQVHNRCLYYQQHLYVPADDALQLQTIQNNHNIPAAGHPRRVKTFNLIRQCYFWPMLWKDIKRFIVNCHVCQRMKTSWHTPYGILNPLPVPDRLWRDISIDFVTGLPLSDSHNAIWVVINDLTKMRHLIPCSTTINAKELANLFIMNIFYLHSLPESIVSDRGPQFASQFWKYLCNSLHIEPHLSTAFHPKTDSQTEYINLVME
jgi:hypothetical protein